MVQENPVNSDPELILVVGATASGKSPFAESLALERGGDILNADSQQFYRGMDIGTGKTDARASRIRHWLLDLCAPGEFMTAMEFARRADEIIGPLQVEGRVAIVVGGTGLYVRALLEGLDASLPKRDPAIRERLQSELNEQGGEALHRRLAQVDPTTAARIHPNDPARLVRFLEIYELTGRSPSQILSGRRPEKLRYRTRTYWLFPPREILRERIASRVKEMIAAGWLEEVKNLMERGHDPRGLSNRPIGYADLADVVTGKQGLQEAVAKIILRTQQYAKRQDTFFRGLLKHAAYQSNESTLEVIAI